MITRSIGRSPSASSDGSRRSGSASSHEDVQTAAGPAEDVAADERRVLADEEHDLLRLAVELDRLDAARQLIRRRRVRDLPPDGTLRRPHRRAVALDEVGRAAVVRPLREQHPHRLPVWVELAVRRQEWVDERHLVVRLVAHDRHFFGPVLRRLPVGVRREPPGELRHHAFSGHEARAACSSGSPGRVSPSRRAACRGCASAAASARSACASPPAARLRP